MSTSRSYLRALVVGAASVACLAALILGAGSREPLARAGAEPATSKCAGDAKPVRRLDVRKVERAVACRVGGERKARGYPAGEVDALLEAAADAHAGRMLRADCFSHRCPGEPDLEERLRRAGYFKGASDWDFAENIGCATTVDAMIRAWLRDRSSRRNLLAPEFEDLGIGFTERAPRGCEGPRKAGAFTLVLGRATR